MSKTKVDLDALEQEVREWQRRHTAGLEIFPLGSDRCLALIEMVRRAERSAEEIALSMEELARRARRHVVGSV